jgi:DedD protein
MENRLKERLTGAAILVALIVALVPEMFRGQRSEVATSSSSSADGAPVRSYTIDLSNNPKSSAPLQSTNDAANTSAPATPSATVPPPAAAAAPPGAAAPVASSAPSAASAPSNAPSPKPAPQPKPTKPATAAGAWSVQVGIFAKHENAERMAHEVQGKGFTVSISNPDASGLFHVRATGMQDRASAQTLSQKMQAAGIKSAVVPAP